MFNALKKLFTKKEINKTKGGFPQPLLENKLTNFPVLLKYWDEEKNVIRPEDITIGSNKKMYWKCDCGNQWELEINNMKKRKYKCQSCKTTNESLVDVKENII